jgi:hypothetical protein
MPGDAAPTLSVLSPYTPEKRFIDIYARGSGTVTFTITPSVSYVTVTPSSGTISYPSGMSEMRANVTVDWASAPNGTSTASILIKPATGTSVTLTLPLLNTAVPSGFKGYVESSGAVAMEMQYFTSRSSGSNAATIEAIPHYGRTDSGITMLPISAGTQAVATAPKAVYTFFSFSNSDNAKVSVYLPPSFNTDPAHPLKYAIAIDGASPTVVQPVPASTLGSMPGGWSESVINGARVVTTGVGKVGVGKHELGIWLLEPGTVVQRVVVDLGGVKSSYLGPPESTKVGF